MYEFSKIVICNEFIEECFDSNQLRHSSTVVGVDPHEEGKREQHIRTDQLKRAYGHLILHTTYFRNCTSYAIHVYKVKGAWCMGDPVKQCRLVL